MDAPNDPEPEICILNFQCCYHLFELLCTEDKIGQFIPFSFAKVPASQ